MDYISNYIEKCRTLASDASKFIGDIFDLAKPYIDVDNKNIHPYIRFVSTQIFISCQMTSESTLLLIQEGNEWDSDILNRSLLEGTFKFIYMLTGTENEVLEKTKEYWNVIP
jgi:hypothetical protein